MMPITTKYKSEYNLTAGLWPAVTINNSVVCKTGGKMVVYEL